MPRRRRDPIASVEETRVAAEMVFWIALAVLAAAVTWAVTRPLMSAGTPVVDAADADVAVYRDQLAEIEVDAARGTLKSEEADVARAEIARRLLRKAGSNAAPVVSSQAADSRFIKPVTLAISAALPVLSVALYLALGNPGLPGQPLSERLAKSPSNASVNDMVARVEARLRDNPEDGQAWDVLAPVYYAMGRYQDAASAFASAIRLLGESTDRLMGFSNARIRTDNGIIAEDVRMALERVRVLSPEKREPRVWLAIAKEQDGQFSAAAADYRALLTEAPADAPWRQAVDERLKNLDGKQDRPAGPSSADVAAAQAMAPDDRAKFIDGMVAKLAARLAADGKDVAGWLMLIRSYQSLGRTAEAEKAITDARRGLEGDEAALAKVNGLAKELGLGG